MSLRHFLNTQDWSRGDLDALLAQAVQFKQSKIGQQLAGKSIALLFFNPSMRTRTSFELGAHQLGGKAIVLAPGKDAWPIEFEVGSVMDGEAEEHIAEVARVLSRYVDMIGVRAFPKFQDWSVDRQDRALKAFARYATVPVINMETITHPCQELAHIMALQQHFGTTDLTGKKYVLTWTYHPRPLEHRRGQFGADHRHALRHGRDAAVPDARVRAGRALHGHRREERRRDRRQPAHEPRHRGGLQRCARGLRQELGRDPVLRSLGRGEAHPRGAQALHRRRGQDGAVPTRVCSATACRCGATSRPPTR